MCCYYHLTICTGICASKKRLRTFAPTVKSFPIRIHKLLICKNCLMLCLYMYSLFLSLSWLTGSKHLKTRITLLPLNWHLLKTMSNEFCFLFVLVLIGQYLSSKNVSSD